MDVVFIFKLAFGNTYKFHIREILLQSFQKTIYKFLLFEVYSHLFNHSDKFAISTEMLSHFFQHFPESDCQIHRSRHLN